MFEVTHESGTRYNSLPPRVGFSRVVEVRLEIFWCVNFLKLTCDRNSTENLLKLLNVL